MGGKLSLTGAGALRTHVNFRSSPNLLPQETVPKLALFSTMAETLLTTVAAANDIAPPTKNSTSQEDRKRHLKYG